VFVHGKLFQPSLMFVGKARSLPQSGAPEKVILRRHDNEHNVIQHNNNQHNDTQHYIEKNATFSIMILHSGMLNVIMLNVRYIECHLC
jgi:hypothetical protein